MIEQGKRTWLKSMRIAKNLSQMDVATLAGISLKHYQRIEYGQRNPAMPIAKQLADYFGFPMDWFVKAPRDNDVIK